MRAQGGEVLSFSAVTPQLISLLDYRCPIKGSLAFALVKSCIKAPHSDHSSVSVQDKHLDLLRRAHPAPHEINRASKANQPPLLEGNAE